MSSVFTFVIELIEDTIIAFKFAFTLITISLFALIIKSPFNLLVILSTLNNVLGWVEGLLKTQLTNSIWFLVNIVFVVEAAKASSKETLLAELLLLRILISYSKSFPFIISDAVLVIILVTCITSLICWYNKEDSLHSWPTQTL